MNNFILELIASILLIGGAIFAMGAGLGVLRMPDFFNRLNSASKASTLGAVLMSLGTAVYFNDVDVWLQCGLVVIFFFATTPMAGHLLARAAYKSGVPYLKKEDFKKEND